MRKRARPAVLLCACTALLLLGLTACNLGLSLGPVRRLLRGETGFAAFTAELHDALLSDDLQGKYAFVDLNGLFARLTGRRVCNGIVRLYDGSLTPAELEMEEEPPSDGVVALAELVQETGAYFLYAAAPTKLDADQTLLPEGLTNDLNEVTAIFLESLRASDVNVLDLGEGMIDTPEQVAEYFFRTDNHWNAEASFLTFQRLTAALSEAFPERGIDPSLAEPEAWERHLLRDWSLGSRGKRVGRFFAGVDDFAYYTPAFPTEISCAVPARRSLRLGDYRAANLREAAIAVPDYHRQDCYSLYFGGNEPLIRTCNLQAPSDLRLLLIKDSFGLPVHAQLSVMFREVTELDPRRYRDSSIAEYILWNRPDAVIVLNNPESLLAGQVFLEFGAEDVRVPAGEPVTEAETARIGIAPGEGFAALDLQPGRCYTLTCGSVQTAARGVYVCLHNETRDTCLASGVFDTACIRADGGFRYAFRTPEAGGDTLRLRLYAGTAEDPADGAVYEHVTLRAAAEE